LQVLAVHLVALLFIALFGFIAGIAGIEGCLVAPVGRLDREEGDLLAVVFDL